MHCQLSEWTTWSDWTKKDNDPPCGEREKTRSITKQPVDGTREKAKTCEKRCEELGDSDPKTGDCYSYKDEKKCIGRSRK